MEKSGFSVLLFFVWLFAIPAFLPGQTSISGTINTYTAVTAISSSTSIDVASSAGFAIGDTVLLIQMKGATIDESDSPTFGDIATMGNAGKYEFATICGITGNTIQLNDAMVNSFVIAPGNFLQMISVPRYQDANVTGTLTGTAWNGTTGGVIVLWVRGTLRLSAAINANQIGFRGAARQDIVSLCSCINRATLYTSYKYPSNDWQGALKGEAIREQSVGTEAGRGKQANGGGGGNDHNTGGAGGANYGGGGNGGNSQNPTCVGLPYCRGTSPGIGGLGLSSTWYSAVESRVFLGGGGGAGHYANNTTGGGSPGGNGGTGGGIVIIVADSIDGNGNSISADGETISIISAADGGGGGGAGGSILVKARAFSGAGLTLNARGGNGANHSWGGTAPNCKGPGGGGGGGVVWHSGVSVPVNVTINTTPGVKGTRAGGSCTLTVNGESDGLAGATLNNLIHPQSTSGGGCGPLPVYIPFFDALQSQNEILLNWEITNGVPGGTIDVLRSTNGFDFDFTGTVAGTSVSHYSFTDIQPIARSSWYKLRVTDADGQVFYSYSIESRFSPPAFELQKLYPNPVGEGNMLTAEFILKDEGKVNIAVLDLMGKIILESDSPFSEGNHKIEIETGAWSRGTYFIRISNSGKSEIHRVFVGGN